MKKALFIYNPESGSRFIADRLDQIVSQLQRLDIQLTLYRIEGKEEALEVAIQDPIYDFIIAAGGDGTIRSVVQKMMDFQITKPLMALGAGTCNNFTTNLEISPDIHKAIGDIAEGKLSQVDIGRVNGKEVFLSSLAAGAFVGTAYETSDKSKNMLGPLAYYFRPLTELPGMTVRKVKITTRTEILEEEIYLFVLLNGKSVGNFTEFLQMADLSDGEMEMVLVKEAAPIEMANLFVEIVKGGDILTHSNITVLRSNYFKVESPSDLPVSLDGEKGPPLPLEIEILPKALWIIAPQEKQ